jgi:hypothetical protein
MGFRLPKRLLNLWDLTSSRAASMAPVDEIHSASKPGSS